MGSKRIFKIMIADDDADDRDLFEDAITDANASVDSASDGFELMQMLKNGLTLPDCIFLDLNMPEKSGKECLQEIRGHERLKHVPVIVYSTSSSKKDIDDTFELGANLYITKPNSFTELKNTVKSILLLDWSKHRPKSKKDTYVFKPY